MAAATMDTGMVTAGISVARNVPRNRKMTMSTRISVSDRANTTFLRDAAMYTPLSMLISTCMSLRQRRLDLREPLLHRVRGREHVGLGLRNDGHRQADGAVGARQAAVVVGGQPHLRHFAEPHQVAVGPAAHHQIAEVLLGAQVGVGAQREFAFAGFEAPGRQLDVLAQQRTFDVRHRELARRQVLARQPHAHGVAPRAVHAHVRHAFERRELVDEIPLHVVGDLEHVPLRARDVEPDDGIGCRRPPW